MRAEKVRALLGRYRLPLLVVLAGVALMLLPVGTESGEAEDAETAEFSLTETEAHMAEVIGTIDGVGRVKVMLTLRSGETLELAEDSSDDIDSGGAIRRERQVLTVSRGSGRQEVVVTQRSYPIYQGAVVVCQGAGDSRVRLTVVEAVSVLTGLSSDKISVVKWKNS